MKVDSPILKQLYHHNCTKCLGFGKPARFSTPILHLSFLLSPNIVLPYQLIIICLWDACEFENGIDLLEFYCIGIRFSGEVIRQRPPVLGNGALLLCLHLLVHFLVLLEVVRDEIVKCELGRVFEGLLSVG
jgi:hypothetical protein